MLFEPLRKKIFKNDNIILHIYDVCKTLVLVVIGLSLFRSGSLHYFFDMWKYVFKNGVFDLVEAEVISKYDLYMMYIGIGFVVFIGLYSIIFKNKPFNSYNSFIKIIIAIILILAIIICGAYGSSYQAVDPMYALY